MNISHRKRDCDKQHVWNWLKLVSIILSACRNGQNMIYCVSYAKWWLKLTEPSGIRAIYIRTSILVNNVIYCKKYTPLLLTYKVVF